ncbi:glycerophosphodiester phosphodiesterase [Pelomonas sp. SE-A7]|uniref:glycerophosphodiester phosphodiesterase n=1 Tax=Pelomonas sp. SE-A7 TaxID=3054953 RepID=UPI00259CDACF|nr:glycerophosphodiester phosphodiesterase [Pelomonas sp. SE-A7]MDM4767463.1 glycerophosphodiester phosphodiesterase [Pelomonas sp. SE-A7]
MTKPWPLPFWIAHRGAGKLAPENTLAAFRLGAAHGYRAFECDVRLSHDGRPFLLHDDKLNRTTSGRGPAGLLSWHELSRLDAGGWHSRAYAGEPIPSLETVAAYCRRNGFGLNLELKPNPGQDEETGRVVALAVRELWAGSERLPLLSSFKPAAVAAAQAAAPELPRGLLIDKARDSWTEEAKALGCSTVITNYALMDRAMVEAVHALGMKALVYTVNDESVARWLMANGLDGIITDTVDKFSPV